MKKQRKPIILVLVLAALCGGAAIMNKPQTAGPGQPPPAKDNQQENKADVANDVASAVKGAGDKTQVTPKPNKPHEGVMPGMDHKPAGMGGPSILKMKVQPFKPKPSDSATSTQWYTDESPRK